jgi:hypothetical protein
MARPSAGCFGSNLQGSEWPNPQLSGCGSVYWEQKGQTLSRIVLALIYRELNGQTLSWVDLSPIYRERNGQTSQHRGCFGSNLQGAEWPDPQLSTLLLGAEWPVKNCQTLSRMCWLSSTGCRMARPSAD